MRIYKQTINVLMNEAGKIKGEPSLELFAQKKHSAAL